MLARCLVPRCSHTHLILHTQWRLASTASNPAPTLQAEYDAAVASGRFQPDASQQAAVSTLTHLLKVVSTPGSIQAPPQPPVGMVLYGPVGSGKTVLMDMFYRHLPLQEAGKSLFSPTSPSQSSHQAAPATSESKSKGVDSPARDSSAHVLRKQRLHFHEWMLAVHQRLHLLQSSRPKVLSRSRLGLPVYRYAETDQDPLDQIAVEVASGTRVLCLDELHVTDVADAMILSRLFEGIVYHGTLVVFTSNRAPKDLYKDGLSRKYFEPFIHLLESGMKVVKVGSGRDYRAPPSVPGPGHSASAPQPVATDTGGEGGNAQQPIVAGRVYVGRSSQQALAEAWQQAIAGWQPADPPRLSVAYGRSIWVPTLAREPGHSSGAAGDATGVRQKAYLTFQQLCGAQGLRSPGAPAGMPMGPSDYLALCSKVDTIFVEGIPRFAPAERDEARRFVTFLDILYEQRCCLVASAECSPDELFLPLLADAARQGINPNLGRSQKLDVKTVMQQSERTSTDRQPTRAQAQLPRALVQEEVIMYHRAASRLRELCAVHQLG